ncbi:MAG: DNA polymerase IV [Verrucomicrobiota bacterium]
MRKIIHLDMDCFYAAVELRERPELAGKPVAVGGGSRRGVVTTANYEARKYGVRSAMPGFQARERCPELIFLPVRFDLYRAESAKIRQVLLSYTPLVEPLSLDEAYLDVTALDRYAWGIAKEIRARIFEETRLTGSAGIAPNKMLAKIASDWRKPNGQFAITPDQVDAFMRELPVRKIWGVGPKSAEKFERQGIHTCGDLQKTPLAELVRSHGKWGQELHALCRGLDDRPVEPNRIRKSLSNETTFGDLLTTLEQCQRELDKLVEELEADLRAKAIERPIHKAFVKVKFADFTRTTKECVNPQPTRETFRALLAEAYQRGRHPVRLLGSGVRFADVDDDEPSGQQLLSLEMT